MTEDLNYTIYDYSDSDDTNTEENSVQPFQVFVATLYSIVFIIGIIGNILLLCFTFKFLHEMLCSCVFNIALADLLFLISLPFWAYDAMAEWIFGGFMCRTVTALYMLGLYESVFSMVLIVLDRYTMVCWAFISIITTSKSKIICFVWILSLLASLPNVIFTREIKETRGTVCVHDFPNPAWRSFTFLNMNLLSFIIPLIIIVFCYLQLYCKLFKLMMSEYQDKKSQVSMRLITMLAVVVVHFLFWAPYNITLFLIILQTNGYLQTFEWSNGLNLAMQWVEIVAYSHCSLNPIIYVLFEPIFREKIIETFQEFSARFCRFSATSLEEVTDVPPLGL
ncbi:C-C chemokine receptor type 5-like isoform X2 [Misgurnus anguillicaudatus]|uniref:C-C chemokine receptor type 5-like isoform X2 n=1 Tax=Misgurnus anguillicaudatus TaxID=75329 RepID=UPI003CCF8921